MSTPQTVGICGAGQMGAAAAVAFKRAGYRTLLWVRDEAKVPTVQAKVADLEAWMDEHVGPSSGQGGAVEIVDDLGRIDPEADLIMDAIAEAFNDLRNLDADGILRQRRQKFLDIGRKLA